MSLLLIKFMTQFKTIPTQTNVENDQNNVCIET